MRAELDHIVMVAADLGAGVAAAEAALGLPLDAGGRHAHFGTHNRLLGLGPDDYFEVIAIDPSAPPPDRTRWFDLDHVTGAPHLGNWVLRVTDLSDALARLGPGYGTPIALSRGDLRWSMAVPESGVLPYDNCAPALIEWESPPPAPNLPERGCRLETLTVSHPDANALQSDMAPFFEDPRVRFVEGAAGLSARIRTQAGSRVLS